MNETIEEKIEKIRDKKDWLTNTLNREVAILNAKYETAIDFSNDQIDFLKTLITKEN